MGRESTEAARKCFISNNQASSFVNQRKDKLNRISERLHRPIFPIKHPFERLQPQSYASYVISLKLH